MAVSRTNIESADGTALLGRLDEPLYTAVNEQPHSERTKKTRTTWNLFRLKEVYVISAAPVVVHSVVQECLVSTTRPLACQLEASPDERTVPTSTVRPPLRLQRHAETTKRRVGRPADFPHHCSASHQGWWPPPCGLASLPCGSTSHQHVGFARCLRRSTAAGRRSTVNLEKAKQNPVICQRTCADTRGCTQPILTSTTGIRLFLEVLHNLRRNNGLGNPCTCTKAMLRPKVVLIACETRLREPSADGAGTHSSLWLRSRQRSGGGNKHHQRDNTSSNAMYGTLETAPHCKAPLCSNR